jgi:TrmH family RNA methyltransferase
MIGKKWEISSLTNEKVKFITSLSQRKYRKELNFFVAEGVRICKEALENNWNIKYLLFDVSNKNNLLIHNLINETLSLGGDVIGVTPQILTKISHKSNPQNILGIFEQKWNDLPNSTNNKCFVALENIKDPGNLGTILRTMDGMGASNCILLNECTDPYSYEAVRASMGAIFNIEITAVKLEEFLKWKIGKNISLIGTSLKNVSNYTEANWQLPFVLAMGNEQKGLSDELLSYCDQLIKIPMLGKSDSLNLAVSTGIVLYESIRINRN